MVNRGSTKAAEQLEKLGTKALMEMLTFGADKIMSADEDKLPSDDDIAALICRSPAGASGSSRKEGSGTKQRDGPLEAGTTQTAATFNAELPLLMTQSLQGETLASDTSVLKDIGQQWVQQTQGKRKRKSRLKKKAGQTDNVLAVNDYSLGSNISVFDASGEQAGANMAVAKPTGRQRAGRDYDNEDHCLECWDGGDLVMCDFCPAAFHPKCLGFKDAAEMTMGSRMGWSCPHHECDKCGRKAAAAGGLLFRCSVCSFASCEDCLPADSKIINTHLRFQALGHRHPREACYILCSSKCVDFSQRKEVRELEADAAQKVLISSAGVLAGTTTTGTANGARAPAAPPALLPGRDATHDPPEWYHTVRLHIPVRRAYFLTLCTRVARLKSIPFPVAEVLEMEHAAAALPRDDAR